MKSPKDRNAEIQRCGEDLQHPIHTIITELVDPMPCTRRTALGKLQCALTSEILGTCDPERDIKPLLRSLLEWFNLPFPSHEILVLSMLSRLVQDDDNRKQLLDLGAVEFMEQYQKDCCPAITPYIISLLHNLQKQSTREVGKIVKSKFLMVTGMGYAISTTQRPLQRFHSGEKGDELAIDKGDYRSPSNAQNFNHFSGNDGGASDQMKEGQTMPRSNSRCESISDEVLPGRPGSGDSRPPSNTQNVANAVGPILPCIVLEESDEKYLFNLNVTLQYLDDREVLRAALKELREAVVFDFHPEAILQKYSIIQNVFVLLQKITDSNLEQMVFDFLLELVRQIKTTLKLYRETSFQVHPYNESPLREVRESGDSGHVKSGFDLECSYPVYVKLHAQSAKDSKKGVQNVAGQMVDSQGQIQDIITLSRTMHLIALQLISLLVNERHWGMTFAVLYEILPLLKPAPEEPLNDKAQVHFTQYFQALCDVLQDLGSNSQDLEILCMDVSTKRNFDKRARHCLPLLRVLIFSAELLCLLQPSHVVGLLPAALVKALTTVAGDLILAGCAFRLQNNILPYLKHLEPEFFKSYTFGTEAAFTLHMLVKVLASSEEAVAQWKAKRPTAALKINAGVLFHCLIQAVPNYAFFNHKYLVPRVVHIIPDVLRLELVKSGQGGATAQQELRNSHKTSVPTGGICGLISQARSLILLLLSHASSPVREIAYDSLLEASLKERHNSQEHKNQKSKSGSGWKEVYEVEDEKIYIDSEGADSLHHHRNDVLRPFSVLHRLLIFGTSIMGEIITVGLHDAATCKQSAGILLHMAGELSKLERAKMIPVYPWIACSAYLSPDLVPLVEQLHSVIIQAKPSLQNDYSSQDRGSLSAEWVEMSCILRSLFSSSTFERCRASTELLKIIRKRLSSNEPVCWWLTNCKNPESQSEELSQGPGSLLVDDSLQFLKDPFQQCLKFKEATLFSLAFGSPNKEVTKISNFEIRPNGQKKVEELLTTFKSTSTSETLRKSAVEHLTWVAQDQSLRPILEKDKELFDAIVANIVEWMKNRDSSSEIEMANRPWIPQKMERSDTRLSELGIACLSFLARLATAAPGEGVPNFRDMLINNSGKVIWSLIPLVFHPFDYVRKNMALLLASTFFSADLLFGGLETMLLDHQTTYHTSTRKILGTSLHFVDKDMGIAVPFPFTGGHLFPCQVVSVPIRPLVQSSTETVVDEQLVHRIITQSVLLQGGHENLLDSLESRSSSAEGPLQTIELQAMACLSVLHADTTIKKLLQILADPQQCYGSETRYLEELEAQCCLHPEAAKFLARSSWIQTFQRFFSRIPSTPEESTKLLKVLTLLQAIINSHSVDASGLLFLTMVSKKILLPILAKSPAPRVGANLHHAIVLIEGYAAIDMDFTILRLFVDILLCSKDHQDESLFGQTATAIAKGTSLLSVLLSKFIKGPSAPYLCCVLAVQCLSLVAKGIAAAVGRDVWQPQTRQTAYSQKKDKESSSETSSEQQEDTTTMLSRRVLEIEHNESENLTTQGECLWTVVGTELVEVVLPLIKHMAHLHTHHYLSLRHKRLVREIVICLWAVTSCVPPLLWEDLWYSSGITYWLSRVLDDQEATMRGMGFGILAVLASPATSKTRDLLEQNWPELGDIVVQTVLNSQECYAVREEALRFLISATIWTSARRFSSTLGMYCPAGFETNDGIGINVALQRYKFWALLPFILQDGKGTLGFYRVLLEFTLKLTRSDVGFTKSQLSVHPQMLGSVIQHLDYGTVLEGQNLVSKCLHSSDIFGAKAYIGEIVSILAQQDDAHIQCLIQNEVIVRKLLCALSYCLGHANLESSHEVGHFELGSTHQNKVLLKCHSSQSQYSVTEYERLEAVFHISEALNLVLSLLIRSAAPPATRVNHIRVNDLMYLNSREGQSQKEEANCSLQSGFQSYLGGMIGQFGVCRGISLILSNVPLVKDHQKSPKTNSKTIMSALFKKMQLALCVLTSTMLSEENLAKAVLDHDISTASDILDNHDKFAHPAAILYNSFLLIMKDVHELARQPKISQDGEFLIYLHRMLLVVGVALQNLISFSSFAKAFAMESDLPSKLMGLAYEAYALLGSCGLAPMRNVLTSPPINSSKHRSKRCNKVPKVVNQPIFPSVWSRKARQGKLSEHHRSLLLGELVIYFCLLKKLVYENPRAVEASSGEGVFDFIRLIWGFAISEEDLLHEVLGFLCNLAAQSDVAKEAVACQTQICEGGTGGSLMDYAAAVVLRLPADQVSYELAVGLLQSLVTMAKARAVFLRKQYLSEFLQHFGQSVHNNDVLRQHLTLQLLINVSVFPNGQKLLSKGLSNGNMLDLVLDTVEQTHYVPASSSALFLLRNLAFCRETRFFFLCNERTLPLLVKSLASSSLEARANAASALWVLNSTERRISSVLKKIDATPSLVAAHQAAKLHLDIFHSNVQHSADQGDEKSGSATRVSKMGKLVTHIEQVSFPLSSAL